MRRGTVAWLCAVALVLACNGGPGVRRNNDNEPGPAALRIDVLVVSSAPYMNVLVHAWDANGDIEKFGPTDIAAGLDHPFDSANLTYDKGTHPTIEVRASVEWTPGNTWYLRCKLTRGLETLNRDGPISIRNKDSRSEVVCKYTVT